MTKPYAEKAWGFFVPVVQSVARVAVKGAKLVQVGWVGRAGAGKGMERAWLWAGARQLEESSAVSDLKARVGC